MPQREGPVVGMPGGDAVAGAPPYPHDASSAPFGGELTRNYYVTRTVSCQ